MKTLARPALFSAALLIALAGCGSDDNTTSTETPDTTPPAVTSVMAIDGSHIDVTFNEKVQRSGAENSGNYVIIQTTTARPEPVMVAEPSAPGDTLRIATVSLSTDQLTASITTNDPMSAVNYDMIVTGVKDASGNAIAEAVATSFAGSIDPDVTPPALVYRNPGPGATGVAIAQPIEFTFSEAVDYFSVVNGLGWTRTNGGIPVPFDVDFDGNHFTLTPSVLLSPGTQYTVSLTGVQDYFANVMPMTSWSYTTTSTADNDPPLFVSSVPPNLATNVSVNTNFSLTFSEPVNEISLEVQIVPSLGRGDPPVWSNGDKTLTFDPYDPLLPNQQYLVSILPGGFEDLAGNAFGGIVTIVFSTGGTLETGRFRGTISGDPNSSAASDPTGAVVAAPDRSPFEDGDNFILYGSAVVAANDTYDIQHLPDGVYYPISVMDTNGDNEIDPSTGDAVGAYGVDFNNPLSMLDSVVVTGGNFQNGIDFPLFDASAIAGDVMYTGFYAGDFYNLFIGVFDTNGFDPTNPPDYGDTGGWPYNTEFNFNTLDDGLADGTYYVAAYLDVNNNSLYDSATDPAGIYGGSTPTAVNIQNGSDALGLTILLEDPAPAARQSIGIAWPEPANRAPWLKKLAEAIRTQVVHAPPAR
jgi:Bacterial Ig-like domain